MARLKDCVETQETAKGWSRRLEISLAPNYKASPDLLDCYSHFGSRFQKFHFAIGNKSISSSRKSLHTVRRHKTRDCAKRKGEKGNQGRCRQRTRVQCAATRWTPPPATCTQGATRTPTTSPASGSSTNERPNQDAQCAGHPGQARKQRTSCTAYCTLKQ